MPIAKPATLPRWANGGSDTPTNTSAPPSGNQDSGFLTGASPPSQWINWLFFWIYSWCEWLNDLTNQALTWTAAHTFSALVTMNGDGTDTGGVRSTTGAPTAHKLIDSWNLGTIKARWYATLNGGFERTINAAWNGANWVPDDTTKPALKELFESVVSSEFPRDRFYRKQDTSGGAFSDASWDSMAPNTTAGSAGVGITNLNATRNGDAVTLEMYADFSGTTGATPTLIILNDGWVRPKHDTLLTVSVQEFPGGTTYRTTHVWFLAASGHLDCAEALTNGDRLFFDHTFFGA